MVWWPAGSPGVADRLPNGEWSPPLVTGTIGECCTSVSGPSVQSVQSCLMPPHPIPPDTSGFGSVTGSVCQCTALHCESIT